MENLSKMKNNNYPNWLVPLYIAKELREIGFREKTFTYFEINTDGEDRYFTPTDINFKELQIYNRYRDYVSIPTWEQVFEWFRECGYLYAIENEICYDFKTRKQPPKIKYTSYFETVGSGVKLHSCTSESYEEAREELVRDLIEIYREELSE
ncbi:Uncharacterised protein [Capnocytophaga sputigena]|jgi:hypothetical protein|nr:Uncharacterised protein [Capnocytophaga sputigena]DAX79492.1 MAG TPA: hypothetical protein [Caudoviricetes sp.]